MNEQKYESVTRNLIKRGFWSLDCNERAILSYFQFTKDQTKKEIIIYQVATHDPLLAIDLLTEESNRNKYFTHLIEGMKKRDITVRPNEDNLYKEMLCALVAILFDEYSLAETILDTCNVSTSPCETPKIKMVFQCLKPDPKKLLKATSLCIVAYKAKPFLKELIEAAIWYVSSDNFSLFKKELDDLMYTIRTSRRNRSLASTVLYFIGEQKFDELFAPTFNSFELYFMGSKDPNVDYRYLYCLRHLDEPEIFSKFRNSFIINSEDNKFYMYCSILMEYAVKKKNIEFIKQFTFQSLDYRYIGDNLLEKAVFEAQKYCIKSNQNIVELINSIDHINPFSLTSCSRDRIGRNEFNRIAFDHIAELIDAMINHDGSDYINQIISKYPASNSIFIYCNSFLKFIVPFEQFLSCLCKNNSISEIRETIQEFTIPAKFMINEGYLLGKLFNIVSNNYLVLNKNVFSELKINHHILLNVHITIDDSFKFIVINAKPYDSVSLKAKKLIDEIYVIDNSKENRKVLLKKKAPRLERLSTFTLDELSDCFDSVINQLSAISPKSSLQIWVRLSWNMPFADNLFEEYNEQYAVLQRHSETAELYFRKLLENQVNYTYIINSYVFSIFRMIIPIEHFISLLTEYGVYTQIFLFKLYFLFRYRDGETYLTNFRTLPTTKIVSENINQDGFNTIKSYEQSTIYTGIFLQENSLKVAIETNTIYKLYKSLAATSTLPDKSLQNSLKASNVAIQRLYKYYDKQVADLLQQFLIKNRSNPTYIIDTLSALEKLNIFYPTRNIYPKKDFRSLYGDKYCAKCREIAQVIVLNCKTIKDAFYIYVHTHFINTIYIDDFVELCSHAASTEKQDFSMEITCFVDKFNSSSDNQFVVLKGIQPNIKDPWIRFKGSRSSYSKIVKLYMLWHLGHLDLYVTESN